jgi:hypothetical protein
MGRAVFDGCSMSNDFSGNSEPSTFDRCHPDMARLLLVSICHFPAGNETPLANVLNLSKGRRKRQSDTGLDLVPRLVTFSMGDRAYTELYFQITNTESILRFLLAGSEAFLVPSLRARR